VLTSRELSIDFMRSALPWWPGSASQNTVTKQVLKHGFWQDAFWTNDFWRTFSFHVIALWALFATIFGSLMTTLFIAGILGVITPKY
jgi:hypothetical protein